MAEIQFIIRVIDDISKNFVSHDSHLRIQYMSDRKRHFVRNHNNDYQSKKCPIDLNQYQN